MNKEEILNKHKRLADLAINHGYVPQGSHGAVHELIELHKNLGMGKVDTYCSSCVFAMFNRLYTGFYFSEPIETTQVEVKADEKMTFPKHHKNKR